MLPSASVSFRGQRAAVVSLISDTHLLDSVGFLRAEDGNKKIMRKTEQKMVQMDEIRARLAKFCFRQLPPASVSFRGQWVAVVSLISDFYLLDSVGNFVDGRREEENYEENGAKKWSKWKK